MTEEQKHWSTDELAALEAWEREAAAQAKSRSRADRLTKSHTAEAR